MFFAKSWLGKWFHCFDLGNVKVVILCNSNMDGQIFKQLQLQNLHFIKILDEVSQHHMVWKNALTSCKFLAQYCGGVKIPLKKQLLFVGRSVTLIGQTLITIDHWLFHTWHLNALLVYIVQYFLFIGGV
jgi:hypothetical protein